MNKIKQILKHFTFQTLETYGFLKIGISIILSILLLLIYRWTDFQYDIWWQLSIIPAAYLGLIGISALISGFIIYPVKSLINWVKKRKNK